VLYTAVISTEWKPNGVARPVRGRAYKRLRVTTVDEHRATNMTVLLLRVFTALGQGNNKMLIYDKSSTHLQLNQS